MRHCSLRETISPTDDKGGGISNLVLNVSGSRQFYAQFSLIWNVYFCQQSHLCPHLALEPGKLIKKWPFFFPGAVLRLLQLTDRSQWRWEEEEVQAAPSDSTADLCGMKSIRLLEIFFFNILFFKYFITFAFYILFFVVVFSPSKLNAIKVSLSEISLNLVKVTSPEFRK